MKTINFLSIISLFALIACNQTPPKEYPVNDPQLGNITTDTTSFSLSNDEQCFLAFAKKDSAFLSLTQEDGKILGKLWYKFYEKDQAKGTLTGTQNQDTLNLTFNFNAEGVSSEMPLKLYYKDGNLYEIHDDKLSEEGKGFIFVKTDVCKL
jgi:uncharacterized protein YcfL